MKRNFIKLASIALVASLILPGCTKEAEDSAKSESTEEETSTQNAVDNTTIDTPKETEEKSIGVLPFEKEYKAISLDDKDKGIHYGEVSYELLHVKDGGEEKKVGADLTNLSEALEEMNSEIENNAKGLVDEYKKDYEEEDGYFYTDDMDKSVAEYSYQLKINIERADENAVSLVKQEYYYTGGAHGETLYSACNFNTKSGQDIKFSDVISDTSGLDDKVVSVLKTDYPYLFDEADDATFTPEETAKDDINELISNPDKDSSLPWYLTYSGISFVFGEYELGPYAAGTPFANISYSDNKDMFNSDIKYDEIPDGSLVSISSNTKMVINEKELALEFSYNYENSETIYKATFDGNEIELGEPENAYMDYSYLARRGDKYFLLKEFISDNALPELHIYDLATGSALSTTYEFSLQNGLNNDLDNLTVSNRIDALSTVDATIPAIFTSDGIITTNGQDYTILSSIGMPNEETPDAMAYTLTAKKDIRCIDGTIKEGEKVRLSKTNADEKAQTITLEKDDGSTVSVLVETKEDGTHTIDGTDENELFDGINYAG